MKSRLQKKESLLLIQNENLAELQATFFQLANNYDNIKEILEGLNIQTSQTKIQQNFTEINEKQNLLNSQIEKIENLFLILKNEDEIKKNQEYLNQLDIIEKRFIQKKQEIEFLEPEVQKNKEKYHKNQNNFKTSLYYPEKLNSKQNSVINSDSNIENNQTHDIEFIEVQNEAKYLEERENKLKEIQMTAAQVKEFSHDLVVELKIKTEDMNRFNETTLEEIKDNIESTNIGIDEFNNTNKIEGNHTVTEVERKEGLYYWIKIGGILGLYIIFSIIFILCFKE